MAEHSTCWQGRDPLMISYHDTYWGVPLYDDKELFAKLILDGAQAGLSWKTVLYKQDHYYKVFDGLDPDKMAYYDEKKIEELLKDPGIIRNRLKVMAAVNNARRFLDMRDRGIRFSEFLWQFVGGKPIVNRWTHISQFPVSTPESDAMSKALRQEGFKFVGSTIVYAFMQAVGMVNDHVVTCPRWKEVQGEGGRT